MYTVIKKVKISRNYFIEIVTKNYLQYSLPVIILYNQYGQIQLSEYAICELCRLNPRLNKLMREISVRGCLNFYVAQQESIITSVEWERHFDFTKLMFVSSWAIETFGFFSTVDVRLIVTKKQLRSLYKAREKLRLAMERSHSAMFEVYSLNSRGKRPKIQPLVIECKWVICAHLKKGEYFSPEILNSLPATLQEFLCNPTFLTS
jgi:hypothetical protein